MDDKTLYERYMKVAIEQANLGKSLGGGEVGCVITKNGEILVTGYNSEGIEFDPTAHAEIVTIRKAGKKLQSTDFSGCTLYCTLQPCGMCTIACIWANMKGIVYGAGRNDVNSLYFDEKHLNTIDYIKDSYNNSIKIVSGVLEEACSRLYKKQSEKVIKI